MASLMTTCLVLINIINYAYSLDYGTCDTPFIIFKHTVATSDSQRECANTYRIFTDIHDEGATKFHDGECAHQCKLELPYTCFKIHAPETFQYDEGLLYIDTFEKKMSEKWKYALSEAHPLDYDAFFDFNIAFWVKSLDEYIYHWLNSEELEYFGIEWDYFDANIPYNKFYSILVHSPSSAINFEFISFSAPSRHLYDNIKWITSNIPRCTFKAQQNQYPWDRKDAATIVPVRISHATTDINTLHDFYVHVLEADLLFYAHSNDGDTETIFMQLYNTHIEIQFIQRQITDTFGAFTLKTYESLLMETHSSIITSPYCGQDRWMDNHYAYSTYNIPGLMDKIYYNLNHYNVKYKVGKTTYEHASVHTKYLLDLVNYKGAYSFGLWVIEPGGQSIKIGGILSDPTASYFAPQGDPQWCQTMCNYGLMQGKVDETHVYNDDLRSSQHEHSTMLFTNDDIRLMDKRNIIYIFAVVAISVATAFAIRLLNSVMCCCCVQSKKIVHDSSHYLSI